MKKIKILSSFVLLFLFGFIMLGCQSVSAAEAYVTIDINPSVELVVNGNDVVIYANPLNEDGEILLANLTLVGLNVDEAMTLIIDEAINLGFIDVDAEETVVSVATLCDDEAIGDQLQTRIKERINQAFQERAMMGRAQDKGFTPEEIAEAETYGVTPAFLRLAKSVVEYDDTITLEDALLLTQQELVAILKEAFAQNREMVMALRDQFHQEREVIFNTFHPQIVALEAEIALLNEQIEAEEGDVAALIAERDQKVLDLEALLETFHQEMLALRASFQEEIEQAREQIMIQNMLRIQENRARVEAFREACESRRSDMMDNIEDFQRGNSN